MGAVGKRLGPPGHTGIGLSDQLTRAVELARAGWTASRIAKQVGVDAAGVRRTCEKAGVELKTVQSYGRGRYGVDLPLPIARVEELPPMPVRPKPAPVVEPEPEIAEEPVALAVEPEAPAAVEPEPVVEKPRAREWTPPERVPVRGAGVPRARDWSPAEDALLRDLFAEGGPAREAAVRLGRGIPATTGRMSKLGLRSLIKHTPAPELAPVTQVLAAEIAVVDPRIRADQETVGMMKALIERLGGGR